MKLIFILSIVSFAVKCMSQSAYIPLPDSNATWIYRFEHYCMFIPPGSTEKYYTLSITGDTSINALDYIKMEIITIETTYENQSCCDDCVLPGYQGAYRQEVDSQRVYFIEKGATQEYLLYDFNLQINDLLPPYYNSSTARVEEVDSILIRGQFRKKLNVNYNYQIYHIEGIGSTYGFNIFNPGLESDQYIYELFCFTQNGQVLFPDNVDSCDISVNIKNAVSFSMNIFPNPFTDKIRIEGNEIHDIELHDLNGRKISTTVFQNNEITLNKSLSKGLYILSFSDLHKLRHRRLVFRE